MSVMDRLAKVTATQDLLKVRPLTPFSGIRYEIVLISPLPR